MATGYSLHIGVNLVDPAHYDGWDGPLDACEADAESMEAICAAAGFETAMLRTAGATRGAVIDAIGALAGQARAGDTVVISYAGHGSQLPDRNGDEDDGYDETWCLHDGQLVDDELYRLWARFPAGTRIALFSDSCHSGTVFRTAMNAALQEARLPEGTPRYRIMPRSMQRRIYLKNRAFYDALLARPAPPPVPAATVVLVSGCQDNQLSADGAFNGAFTAALIEVWNNGRFTGSYADLAKAARRLLPTTQSPNYAVLGGANAAFTTGRAFAI